MLGFGIAACSQHAEVGQWLAAGAVVNDLAWRTLRQLEIAGPLLALGPLLPSQFLRRYPGGLEGLTAALAAELPKGLAPRAR